MVCVARLQSDSVWASLPSLWLVLPLVARVRYGPHHPAFNFEPDLPLPFQGVALLGPHHPANPTKLALKWRTLRGLRVLVESHSPWVSLG